MGKKYNCNDLELGPGKKKKTFALWTLPKFKTETKKQQLELELELKLQ